VLLQRYIPPPRPIIPYGEWITNAVDKIAQAADPVNRAQRRAALGELSLAPQKLELEKAQLGAMSRYYQGGGSQGYGGNPTDPTPKTYWTPQGIKTETPQQAMSRANAGIKYQGSTQDAGVHNDLVNKAQSFWQNQPKPAPQYTMNPQPEPNFPTLQLQPTDLSQLKILQNQDDQ
jgi:hypothetical protein